jgi:hypothetical protein
MSGFGAETKVLLLRCHRRDDFSDANVIGKFDVSDDLSAW